MTRTTRKAMVDCEAIIMTVEAFRRDLPELIRRNRFAASGDGYPRESMAGPAQRGAVSHPTEVSALNDKTPDPVRSATKEALRALSESLDAAYRADNLRKYVLDTGGNKAMRTATIDSCVNCHVVPLRLRDRRCNACYQYRRRTGRERPIS